MLGILTVVAILGVGCTQIYLIRQNKELKTELKISNRNMKDLYKNTNDLKINGKFAIDAARDNHEAINNISKIVRVAVKEELRNLKFVKIEM